jgi:hypothetical protein
MKTRSRTPSPGIFMVFTSSAALAPCVATTSQRGVTSFGLDPDPPAR